MIRVVPTLKPYQAECPVCETDSGMVVAVDIERAGEQLSEMGWGEVEEPGGKVAWYCPGCWPVVSGGGRGQA